LETWGINISGILFKEILINSKKYLGKNNKFINWIVPKYNVQGHFYLDQWNTLMSLPVDQHKVILSVHYVFVLNKTKVHLNRVATFFYIILNTYIIALTVFLSLISSIFFYYSIRTVLLFSSYNYIYHNILKMYFFSRWVINYNNLINWITSTYTFFNRHINCRLYIIIGWVYFIDI